MLGATACGEERPSERAPVAGSDGCPYWSPDGRWIAFDRAWGGWGSPTGGNSGSAFEERDVLVVGRAGRRARRLTVTAGDEYVLGWRGSPPQVVFERVPAGTVWWHHYTTDALQVAHSVFSVLPAGQVRARPIARLPKAATIVRLSPNGRLLVLGYDSDDANNRFVEYRVGLLGRRAAPILPHGTIGAWVSWSPDSTRLDYSRPHDGPAVSVVLGPDGSVRGHVRGVPGAYRTVGARSPDGRLVASLVWSGVGPDRAAVSWADGSHRRLVARADGVPTWSPDSRLLYYEQNADVRSVEADGTHDRRIAQTGGGGFQCLAVSPDGRRIAFLGLTKLPHSGFLGLFDRQLFVMNADGSDKHAVALGAELSSRDARTY